ncbi:Stimulated by retinoic acid protein 6 protein-like [Bulinus truncatus]|nr:Stimulated by retinoic acid protein 6 protein-like [Bulinus truncatus]
MAATRCYGDLGCFDSGSLMALPQDPSFIRTQFQVSCPNHTDSALIDATDDPDTVKRQLESSCFQVYRDTQFIIHGYNEDVGAQWLLRMRDGLLKKGDYNVIIVDWHHGSRFPYEQAAANMYLVARQLAKFLRLVELILGLAPPRMHLIGYSLGAQLAGATAAALSPTKVSISAIKGVNIRYQRCQYPLTKVPISANKGANICYQRCQYLLTKVPISAIKGANIRYQRKNLYALYRGDNEYIPLASELGAVDLCVGSIKYAGFQVAYFIWGYFITTIVLCIICIVLGIFILVLKYGYTDWLVYKVLQIWPGVLIALVLLVVQKLLARFLFLQGDGQHLRLDNRRFYFIFTYFMFFYNIFLGIASCLLRIVKSIAVGILFLSRLDNSSMPRRFEFFDPGFSAYKGYIHMEVAHTHPVVLVFIQLLYTLSRDRKSPDSTELTRFSSTQTLKLSDHYSNMGSTVDMSRQRNRAAQFNWFVIYTLLHNPTVRIYRKGFIQSMRKAIKEGLKMPISDKPITDFDLVKMQEEKEKEEKKCLPEPNNTSNVYLDIDDMLDIYDISLTSMIRIDTSIALRLDIYDMIDIYDMLDINDYD